MPYANNNGVRIHYQVEGEGPPLVLQHGFTSSLQSWYASGYVAALQRDHQLILIDARGHGQSVKPYDPNAYAMQNRVEDVLAVLDALQVETAHYLGYSMGGRIGFGIARYRPERFISLIIGGMHPYESTGASAQERIALLQQGMAAYVAHAERLNGPMAPDRKARLLANAPQALIASLRAPRGLAGIEQLLPTMTIPFLLYVGEADSYYPGAQECVKHMLHAHQTPDSSLSRVWIIHRPRRRAIWWSRWSRNSCSRSCSRSMRSDGDACMATTRSAERRGPCCMTQNVVT